MGLHSGSDKFGRGFEIFAQPIPEQRALSTCIFHWPRVDSPLTGVFLCISGMRVLCACLILCMHVHMYVFLDKGPPRAGLVERAVELHRRSPYCRPRRPPLPLANKACTYHTVYGGRETGGKWGGGLYTGQM